MSSIPDFNVTLEIPIAWGDMDALGHVNNTMFFRYFESARIAYLTRIEFIGGDSGFGPILASTQCRFRKPLTFPDTVIVGARCISVASDRFTHQYRIVNKQGDVVAEGDGVVVAYNYNKGMKCPIPDDVRERIRVLDGI